jgi:membrane protein involved in colicin uptake
MAKSLFDITTFRTKVHIVEQLENCYPAREALVNGVGYQESVRRREEAEQKLNKLRKQAEEEIAAKLAAEQKAAGKKVTAKPAATKKKQKVAVAAPAKPVSNVGRVQSVMSLSR